MSEKKLLREWYPLEYNKELIKEAREQNGGKLMLQGIMQRANVKNQNKRVYPKRILEREIENYMKAVRESRAMGECDHPESSTVSLKNVSHVIREMWWDGDSVMGKLEILPTPAGKILEALVEAGVTIGISSRGVGSTSKMDEGTDMVQDDFALVAFDAVSEPSTPGAYLHEGRLVEDPKFSRPDRVYRVLNDILRR